MKQISLAYSPAHSGLFSGSKWLSVVPCGSRSGPHSLAHYWYLISLIKSLRGSQGLCSAHSAAATLARFIKVGYRKTFFLFWNQTWIILFIYQPVQSKSLFVISVSKISCDTETLPTSSTLPSLSYSRLPRFRKYFHLVAPCLGRSHGEPTSEQQSPTFQVQA